MGFSHLAIFGREGVAVEGTSVPNAHKNDGLLPDWSAPKRRSGRGLRPPTRNSSGLKKMPAFRRRYDCRYPLFHRLYSVVHGGDDSPQTCCASAAGAPLKREEEPGHRCAPLRLRRAPSRWRGQGARRCVNRRGAPGGPAIVLRPERRRYRWIGGR